MPARGSIRTVAGEARTIDDVSVAAAGITLKSLPVRVADDDVAV